jgi:hypothetical protein
MSKNSKNMKIVGLDGPPCPRCGCPTEIREHERITEKEWAKRFYYSRWYICRNRDCMTTNIMPDEFRVWNENKEQRPYDVVTATTKRWDSAERQVRNTSSNKAASPPIKSSAVFVKEGFKASLCLECAHVDLIRANEDHRPCTVCGAKPSLP